MGLRYLNFSFNEFHQKKTATAICNYLKGPGSAGLRGMLLRG